MAANPDKLSGQLTNLGTAIRGKDGESAANIIKEINETDPDTADRLLNGLIARGLKRMS